MNFEAADTFATMLVEQYRMNELIMNWSSQSMYQGRLVAHNSVSQRTIQDLINDGETNETGDITGPLLFIDTAGSLMYEGIETEVGVNESKYNFGEVDLVIHVMKELFEIGLNESQIGVITPYSAQVSEIRKELKA